MWGWSQWALLLAGGSALALRALAQPSYLCQCDALLWAPVQQTDPNMTEWHDTLAVEVARNDLVDASRVRPDSRLLLSERPLPVALQCLGIP